MSGRDNKASGYPQERRKKILCAKEVKWKSTRGSVYKRKLYKDYNNMLDIEHGNHLR